MTWWRAISCVPGITRHVSVFQLTLKPSSLELKSNSVTWRAISGGPLAPAAMLTGGPKKGKGPTCAEERYSSVEPGKCVPTEFIMVGWCRLKPVYASTKQVVLRLGSLTQHLRVLLWDPITCYSIGRAWFQRLKLK